MIHPGLAVRRRKRHAFWLVIDYAEHPYVRWRREVMPDLPFAVIDGLAMDNWRNSNPLATHDEIRDAMLAREYVLWSSHAIDESCGEIVAIAEIESPPPWPPIRVAEVPARDVRTAEARVRNMNGGEQSHSRFITAKSQKQAIETRDRLWREDLLTGNETQKEAAYRLRCLSVDARDFKAVICDKCGLLPAHGGVTMFGSAKWILTLADAGGWSVPGRWQLDAMLPVEATLPAADQSDLAPISVRIFALCESCQPISVEYGEIKRAVEPGHEHRWETFVQWQLGGQDSVICDPT